MMILHWYQWMALAALGICILICLMHFIRLIKSGKPSDYSRPAGKTGGAIRYAFTKAMSPAKKESAFLHLPTYTAGLLYHVGTFLSFFLFFIFLAGIFPQGWLANGIMTFLFISAASGLSIFFKRIIKKELLFLSNPDDFISNFLVTAFQILTLLYIIIPPILQSPNPRIPQSSNPPIFQSSNPPIQLIYYFLFTLLMLYIPVGKLRHTVYFFAARYHLGYFFGWRGVWPPGNVKN